MSLRGTGQGGTLARLWETVEVLGSAGMLNPSFMINLQKGIKKWGSTPAGGFTDASPGIERVETSDGFFISRADILNIVNAMVAYNISDTMTMSAQYASFMNDPNYQALLAQGWQPIANPQA